MKISTSQEKLNKALSIISRVAVSKSTLPILSNILIRSNNKKVSLISTNLDMAITYFLPTSNAENGVTTIPARLFSDFISNLPKGETIDIKTDDTKAVISTKKYKSSINCTPADDFPEIPELNEKEATIFKVNAEEFKTSISQVIVASSNDLTRPALTGIYFNTNQKTLAVAATDGYRLAEKILIDKVSSEVQAIVPATTLHEVLRSLDEETEEVEIAFSEDLVRFRFNEIEIVSKLIDASFPDYKKLFPKSSDITLTIDREELIRVTKLAALFARSIGGSIVCEAKPKETFLVKSIANEFGENNSDIKTKVEKAGKVNLNSRFLLDALNALEEPEIIFKFSNHITPVVITNKKSDKYTHIIMPLNS